MRPYIAGVDMGLFKYDDFIRVLDIVNRCAVLAHAQTTDWSSHTQTADCLIPKLLTFINSLVLLQDVFAFICMGGADATLSKSCVSIKSKHVDPSVSGSSQCALTPCRLVSIGVEFCGEGSDSLQESMRQQSLKYFRNHHRCTCTLQLRLWKALCAFNPDITLTCHSIGNNHLVSPQGKVGRPEGVSRD